MEEFIALADPRLSIFTEDESAAMETDFSELPQHKITDYTYVTMTP